jgi:hypothetical protein
VAVRFGGRKDRQRELIVVFVPTISVFNRAERREATHLLPLARSVARRATELLSDDIELSNRYVSSRLVTLTRGNPDAFQQI